MRRYPQPLPPLASSRVRGRSKFCEVQVIPKEKKSTRYTFNYYYKP